MNCRAILAAATMSSWWHGHRSRSGRRASASAVQIANNMAPSIVVSCGTALLLTLSPSSPCSAFTLFHLLLSVMTMDEARRRSVEELTEKKKEKEEHPRKGLVKAKENIQGSIQ